MRKREGKKRGEKCDDYVLQIGDTTAVWFSNYATFPHPVCVIILHARPIEDMHLVAAAVSAVILVAAAETTPETTGLCDNASTRSWFTSNPLQDYKGPPRLRINRTVGSTPGDVSAHTCAAWCLAYEGENGPCVAFSVQVEYGVCQLFRAPTSDCIDEVIGDGADTATGDTGGTVEGRRRRCVTEEDLPLKYGENQAHFVRLPECADRTFGEVVSTTTTVTTATTPTSLCEGSVSLWFDTPVYDHKGPLALRVNRYFGPATVAECAQVCVKHETGCTAFSYRADDVTCQIFEGSPDSVNEATEALVYSVNTVHYTRKTACSVGRDASVAAAWKRAATQAVCGQEPFVDGFEDPVEHFKGILDDRMARYSASSLTAEHCAASCLEHTPVCTSFSFNTARFVCSLFRSDSSTKPELVYQSGQRHYARKAECVEIANDVAAVQQLSTDAPEVSFDSSGADDDYYGARGSGRGLDTSAEPKTAPSPTLAVAVEETSVGAKPDSTTTKTKRPPAFVPPKVSTNDVVASDENSPPAVLADDDGYGGGTTFQSESEESKQIGSSEIAEIVTAIVVVSLLMVAFFVWVYREHYPESSTAPRNPNAPHSPRSEGRTEHIPLLNPAQIVPVPLTLDDYMIPHNNHSDHYPYPRTPERYLGV